MRWRYPDPAEAPAREAVLSRIDAWWQAFAAQVPRLDAHIAGTEQWDLVGWMNAQLEPVEPALAWEFGPALRGGRHRLVLTHESRHDLRPLVDVVLARAPALPGWELYAHRPAETAEHALGWVKARAGADFTGYVARTEPSGDGRVHVTFTRPAGWAARLLGKPKVQEELHGAACVAAECLLDGDVFDARLGAIVVESRGDGLPLDALAGAVRAHVDAWQATLPERPYHQFLVGETGEGAVLELHPKEREDGEYPERSDLRIAVTHHLPLHRGLLASGVIDSQRLSRHGETFCYLKLDGAEGFGEGGLADRNALRDAVDAALRPAGLGCVVGGGTGLRYAYVDLALTDVVRAMDVMRAVLRAGRAPRRSWLQFFDDALAAEWLPVWDGAPPPPMTPWG